jgi:Flp pilus assembly protein TadG
MTILGSPLRREDAGSIVFGWLGRVALTLTILGLVIFETLSVVTVRVSLQDIGTTAADQALTTYSQTHNPYQAYLAADAYATENGAALVKSSFTITEDSVSFQLTKTAPTLLLYRFSFTKGLAQQKTTIYEEPIVQGGSMP